MGRGTKEGTGLRGESASRKEELEEDRRAAGKGHSGAPGCLKDEGGRKKPCFPDNSHAGPFNRTFTVYYYLIFATQQKKHFTEKVL